MTADEVNKFCERMQAVLLDAVNKGQHVCLQGPEQVYKRLIEDEEEELFATLFVAKIRHAPRFPPLPAQESK